MLIGTGIVCAALLIGLAWTGNLGKVSYLVKGLVSVFVDSKIKTVEGARAVYNTAIEQAKEELDSMKEAAIQISGQRQTLEKDIKEISTRIPVLTKNCDQLVKSGHREDALPLALEKSKLEIELSGKMAALPTLQSNEKEALALMQSLEERIISFKQERDITLNEITLNSTIANANAKMADIRSKVPTKMLETVREGLIETRQRALGSDVVNKSLITSKIEAASNTTNILNANSFLDSLEPSRKSLQQNSK